MEEREREREVKKERRVGRRRERTCGINLFWIKFRSVLFPAPLGPTCE
jgi:hypothetical protein